MYSIAYMTHIAAVVVSGSFFLLRGIWMLMEHPALDRKLVRILPHIIDTVLLVSAITLAVLLQQYPITDHWLTVKVVALIAYIGFGMFAIRRGTKQSRIIFLVLALATFAFMVGVAMTKHPLGWLALG